MQCGLPERFTFQPGRLVIFNDPYLGGTHLPDITMVSGVFEKNEANTTLAIWSVAPTMPNVGGMSAGSMPSRQSFTGGHYHTAGKSG